MKINDQDWQRVVAAYKRGQSKEREYGRALKHLGDAPINEDGVRTELKRLARCVSTISNDTLRVLEVQTPFAIDDRGICRPALSNGLLAGYIADAHDVMQRPNEGPSVPWRHREAAAVLRELWPGKRGTGRGSPRFNPMVRWMGLQLQKLEPDLKAADIDVARQAAHTALKSLATSRS